jgi:hypothetical protein
VNSPDTTALSDPGNAGCPIPSRGGGRMLPRRTTNQHHPHPLASTRLPSGLRHIHMGADQSSESTNKKDLMELLPKK